MLDLAEVEQRVYESTRVTVAEERIEEDHGADGGKKRVAKRLVVTHGADHRYHVEVDRVPGPQGPETEEFAHGDSLKRAAAFYNAVGNSEIEKLSPPYRKVGDMDADSEGFHHKVFAVGETPEDAIAALCRMIELDEPEDIVAPEDDNVELARAGGWFRAFRMKSSGTSMKASGLYVPGGAILHWWK